MLEIAQARDSQNNTQEILVQNRNSYTMPADQNGHITPFQNISGGLVVGNGKGANIVDTLATSSSY